MGIDTTNASNMLMQLLVFQLTLNGMGTEKFTRYGGGVDSPSIFPLFEGQLKQNLEVWKYVTNSIQNRNIIDDFITGSL